VCSWYTSSTDSIDPSQWEGGDFLPIEYALNANCACGGVANSNPLWDGVAASCVRTSVLKAHQTLPNEFKEELRNARDNGTLMNHTHVYVDTLYELHTSAYEQCCCPGTPAPIQAWYAVFWFQFPCMGPAGIADWILLTGRCGCGW